jgi:hypothetical protein
MSLARLVNDALPLLMRKRVIDAVLAAQAGALGPVTSAEARRAKPVLRNARSFSDCARRIAQMGPDEHGRALHRAGRDRNGFALWWVEERE